MNYLPLYFVIAMIAATVLLGIQATRASKSASDFFVAGRSVSVFWNASAISGEYLSAASFLGIAGLVMKNGYDALWYPVGYAAGYLLLLLFIAGPLRRFGAYTIPDFAEGRFDSPAFRKVAVIFVLCIGLFYTMPQMKGAGATMGAILGWPYWVGIIVVGTVIVFNVVLGGMKGITVVQAFQYWAKAFAISIPVFVLMSVYGSYGHQLGEIAAEPKATPAVESDTTIKWPGKDKAPSNTVAFSAGETTQVIFPKGAVIDKIGPARKPEPGEDKIDEYKLVSMTSDTSGDGKRIGALTAYPVDVTKEGQPVEKDGKGVKTGAKVEFAEATEGVLPAGSLVPNSQNNAKWMNPFGTLSGKYGYPVLYTYSLIIALLCGTAGLPHILVRFYTNPDGRAAKRTTFWVMILLGVFYAFTPLWGTIGRTADPALYANSKTDVLLILVPKLLENKTLGAVLSGITAAGAFAAFMSTFSGLLVSMSGAFAHDIYGKILKPQASAGERLTAFKAAAVVVGIVSMGLGLIVESFDIALLVGWAFAIAAASYFPLLLLGAWWKGLTRQGAMAGMLIGGTLSFLAIATLMMINLKVLNITVPPLGLSLMEQPAIWGVPLSIFLMIVVSLATKDSVPKDINVKMLRLHAPEEMGLSKNYIDH